MLIRPYRWYGGKLRMAHIINYLIPEHTAYYEPFMGSAAVLLNHPRSRLEVVSDLDSELVHLMKTLADREKGKVLVERLCGLWYDRHTFEEAKECRGRKYRGMDEIDKAVMVFILITQSFNCTRKTFSGTAFKDTGQYRRNIEFHLPKVYERLENVRVKNMDGTDLLKRIADNPDAFAFVDPPYCHNLRGKGADQAYQCELPHSGQVRLLKTIRGAKAKIMLCGYRQAGGKNLYDNYLLPHGWKCYKLAEVVKACQVSDLHKDMAEEFIWVNYELPKLAKYAISMKEYGSL